MKKKNIANLAMICIIAVIVAAGILGVGHIQGWFDAADGTQAVLEETRGIIQLLRGGVSYPVSDATVLRSGDQLSCQSGATAVIRIGSDQLVVGEKASLTIIDPAASAFSAQVHTGELFAHCDTGVTLQFDSKEMKLQQATVLLSVRSGAQSISVLRGVVEEAKAGQILQFIGEEKTVGTLALASLNDFATQQIRKFNDSTLCFTVADLDQLAADRQQALQDLLGGQTKPTVPPAEPTDPTETTAPTQAETTVPPETTTPPETAAPSAVGSCYITIRCDTILQNMDDLEPGKAEFVPYDGTILPVVQVAFFEGETVFDVLKRVCDAASIQLEYSWTPLYDSYYVEGIHNLYEFDCGFESGWMYKVNEWFPNYGCSSYTLKDGDVIVWCYTCKGLGTDVGAERME